MDARHEPTAEFTRFVEWQTRTEVRRAARFSAETRRPRSVARWLRTAALVAASLFTGAGAVFAVERIQDSRALEIRVEQNALELQLAERRLELARSSLESERQLHEQGVISIEGVALAERRASALERERDQRRLESEELSLARRAVDRRLVAPLVGGRDFVAESLIIDRAFEARELELAQARLERVRLRVDQGIESSDALVDARTEANLVRVRLARIDQRLFLRGEFLAARIEARECEQRDRSEAIAVRLDGTFAEVQRVMQHLERAEMLEREGVAAGTVAPLQAELDRLDVERRLLELELELLRRPDDER